MIRVVAHEPAWAAMYEAEAERIVRVAGKAVVRMHHIGSTAIPATRAKPVIDMLLEGVSLAALDEASPRLEALGYEAKGEFGIPGRRYFRLDDAGGTRTHQMPSRPARPARCAMSPSATTCARIRRPPGNTAP